MHKEMCISNSGRGCTSLRGPENQNTLCYCIFSGWRFGVNRPVLGPIVSFYMLVFPQYSPVSSAAWHLQPNRARAHRQCQEQPRPGSACQRVPEVGYVCTILSKKRQLSLCVANLVWLLFIKDQKQHLGIFTCISYVVQNIDFSSYGQIM